MKKTFKIIAIVITLIMMISVCFACDSKTLPTDKIAIVAEKDTSINEKLDDNNAKAGTTAPTINIMCDANQVINAKKLISLPNHNISDDASVGLVPFISITHNGKAVSVINKKFFAPTTLGAYIVKYEVTDSDNMRAEKTITLDIQDNDAPIIDLRGVEVGGLSIYAKNSIRFPMPILTDFYDILLKIDIKTPSGMIVENFNIKQKYLPMETGKYEIKYTATENVSLNAKSSSKTVILKTTDMYKLNFLENGTDVRAWEKGGGFDPRSYPVTSINTDNKYVKQGSASMKAVYNGVEGATADYMPAIYMYFSHSGITDVSLLSGIYVDVYNANDMAIDSTMTFSDGNQKAYRTPKQKLEPHKWTTVKIMISAAKTTCDTSNPMSIVFSIDGFSSGVRTIYVDNVVVR